MTSENSYTVLRDVPLASRTTLGVGGPARRLAACRDLADVRAALASARQRDEPVTVLGGGSNLLVADAGFDGLVLTLEDDHLHLEDLGDGSLRLRAGAGLGWDRLVETSVDAGLAGLEALSGIPGRVGAAPIQNVGAYGQEVAETVERVHAVETRTGEERWIAGDACGFAYRTSHFKTTWRDRFAIVAVDFRLRRRATGTIRYPQLARRLGVESGGRAASSLAEIRRAVLEIRREKSMVLKPGDPNRRSAGSFFTNPIVAPERLPEIRRRLGEISDDPSAADDLPAYPQGDGRVKLPAAFLIERAGITRGFRLGRAAVSSRHTLALVNTGGSTAAEIVALAGHIRRTVYRAFDIRLEPEPVFLGFDASVDDLLT